MAWPRCIIIHSSHPSHGSYPFEAAMHEFVPAVRHESTTASLRTLLGPHLVGVVWEAQIGQEDDLRELLREEGVPGVRVHHDRPDPCFPVLDYDHYAEGRLGAEHLLEQGFEHFGFWTAWEGYTAEIERGFVETVQAAGYQVARSAPPDTSPEEKQHLLQRMKAWLQKIPLPLAAMAPMDYLNIRLLEACYELDLHIPGDVALLGVGDEPSCTQLEMKISSVRPGHDRLGRTAARMLMSMHEGQKLPPERILMAPDGISVRRSSVREPRDDPLVARALDYLRGTPIEEIDLEEMSRRLPASRRTVQRRFKAALGHSVRQELRRLRIRKAQHLLEVTDLTLADIAVRTGYEHISSLCRAFKAETGETPDDYREPRR